MSTRANIILKDGKDKMYFYRHSDGYPSGTLPTLNKFLDWLKSGKIRADIMQGSGWLIVLGALEYSALPAYKTEIVKHFREEKEEIDFQSIGEPKDWKVGAYEPTACIHGDIEWLYTIDLPNRELEIHKVTRTGRDYAHSKQVFTLIHESDISFA